MSDYYDEFNEYSDGAGSGGDYNLNAGDWTGTGWDPVTGFFTGEEWFYSSSADETGMPVTDSGPGDNWAYSQLNSGNLDWLFGGANLQDLPVRDYIDNPLPGQQTAAPSRPWWQSLLDVFGSGNTPTSAGGRSSSGYPSTQQQQPRTTSQPTTASSGNQNTLLILAAVAVIVVLIARR